MLGVLLVFPTVLLGAFTHDNGSVIDGCCAKPGDNSTDGNVLNSFTHLLVLYSTCTICCECVAGSPLMVMVSRTLLRYEMSENQPRNGWFTSLFYSLTGIHYYLATHASIRIFSIHSCFVFVGCLWWNNTECLGLRGFVRCRFLLSRIHVD